MKSAVWIIFAFAALALFFGCSSNSGDDDVNGPSDDDSGHGIDDDSGANIDDDTGNLDDDTNADDDSGDDDTGSNAWNGVSIENVDAPNELTVNVAFNGDPGKAAAEDLSVYSIDSSVGSLTLTAAQYNPLTKTVQLTSKKQKLGITYTLIITPGENSKEGLTEDFISADTAQFWATDFSSPNFPDYQLTADRAAVGTYSVIYIEQGMSASDVAQAISEFDDKIYPIETNLFTTAPDVDGNGKILMLGLNGGDYYGGYFTPVNEYSEEQTMQWWGLHSNEMDMIYINVIGGTLNVGIVIPHEFQHMLYHKRHGFTEPYFDYHDEGLAECATHAVYGVNSYAISYYEADPNGKIGNGMSLVHWEWGVYEHYAVAYLFWTYLASRLNDVPSYHDIFDLDTGSPEEVNAFIAANLLSDFPTVQSSGMLANWIQSLDTIYGYGDMLYFAGHSSPKVTPGITSLDLEPFGGAFFHLTQQLVNYPGTQGEHIMYIGVDPDDNVDLTAPFFVNGGVLLVLNANQDYNGWPTEHSGPDLPAQGVKTAAPKALISPAWLDPPPINPYNLESLRQWREAAIKRIAEGE